eukprot:350396-Chlamydomonas_euryale.AAC.5
MNDRHLTVALGSHSPRSCACSSAALKRQEQQRFIQVLYSKNAASARETSQPACRWTTAERGVDTCGCASV